MPADLDNNRGRRLHQSLRKRRMSTMYNNITTARPSSPASTYAVLVFLCLSCWFVQGAKSFVITPKEWDFLQKHSVGYEVARPVMTAGSVTTNSYQNNTSLSASTTASGVAGLELKVTPKTTNDSPSSSSSSSGTPILLLNGFGVGSFHQHRLIERLFTASSSSNTTSSSTTTTKEQRHPTTVYCMDYLGQGRSWPKQCQDGRSINEQGLQYSAELWVEQIITFIEDIIQPSEMELKDTSSSLESGQRQQRHALRGCKVHIVGNSVGGHLAAYVAARRPDLVESIVLLNPTPVWGLNLPGWTGHLPPPPLPRAIGRFLFDRIRDLKTIESFLKETYSRREAFSDELVSDNWEILFIRRRIAVASFSLTNEIDD